MDLLRTFAKLAGAESPPTASSTVATCGRSCPARLAPKRRTKDISTTGQTSPGRPERPVEAAPAHDYDHPDPPGHDGRPGKYAKREISPALFDLETDLSETNNVAGQHPDVVVRLQALAEQCREDLGDSATGREGKNVRPPGRLREN